VCPAGGCESDEAAPLWKRELAEAFTRAPALLAYLGLDSASLARDIDTARDFPMLVPRSYADAMRRGDPADPLLRQVLPLKSERKRVAGYARDPVDDTAARRAPGLLQKYAGRALLMPTGACAVHCRYCFRRHYPYADSGPRGKRLDDVLQTLADAVDINEVILSGGDPLMLDDSALAELTARLAQIAHLRRLRLHTRLPVVLPSRITASLCRTFAECRLRPVVVIHANHPAELGPATRAALARLRACGTILFNQSVLLRGVNDDAAVLAALAEALFEAGVVNYYLHQLDRVEGAAHFEVPDDRALSLMAELRAWLPGYLVPRLVREEPGAPSKTPLL
jgi:EF-P beta-lysylation protein EpmB